ncbi:2OG-Fe(II)-dependent halogenase WelO5 family protein [Glycomyces sp. MUSA5-2]|uniref:2OG-Fe(II)-dependent halogenase WelO5 family protein n=1 Tax=Glycomyces sp. MUSA5-2 TaxID=2053002 RepID=UPI003009B410
MDATVSHDPLFEIVTSSTIQRNTLADLAAEKIAAIRIPDFLTAQEQQDLLERLLEAEFESYGSERVYPQVMRFGVAVSDYNEHGTLSDRYWEALDSNGDITGRLKLPYDPFRLCRERIGAELPFPVEIGTRRGRSFAPGVFREPNNGFQVHFDDARREFPTNLVDENLIAQFAFNLYLSVPEEGGETVIWRHHWMPEDESHRLPNSYGYAETVVARAESLEIRPNVGDVLLLNPRFFHAVRPSRGARRISLGFSLGLTDDGRLLTWG